jgi:hypothetical protein
MNARLLIFFLITILAFFNSCITSPISETSSLKPMSNKIVAENLGETSGEDSQYSMFGLFMFERPNLEKAIEDAVKSKGADTLINVRCYETTTYYLLFSKTTVRVEGEAVKLSDVPKEPAVKRKKK